MRPAFVDSLLARAVGAAARLHFPIPRSAASTDADRIAVVRSTSLGDFVVLLPFLAALGERHRGAAIDLLLISRSGPVASLVLGEWPGRVCHVDPSSRDGLIRDVRAAKAQLGGRGHRRIYFATQNSEAPEGKLRKLSTARAVLGIRAPVVGLAYRDSLRNRTQLEREPGVVACNQARVPFVACGMEAVADRARTVGLLAIRREEQAEVDALLARLGGVGQGPLVAMHVHAKDERKRWPLDRFVECGEALRDRHGARFLLVGGPEDRAASDHLAGRLGASRTLNLAGETSARSTFCALKHCDLFVGNDAAPMHLAALAGVPIVAVFCAWEVPGIWEPIAAPSSWTIRPEWSLRTEGDFGITQIRSDVVLGAVAEALGPGTVRPGAHEILFVGAQGSTRREAAGPPIFR